MVTAFTVLAISVRLVGNNSLINLPILRVLASLKLFFNHEFYCILPGLTGVYNNCIIVPAEKIFASYELVFELARRLWDCQNGIHQ